MDLRFLRISVVYLIVGASLGAYMGFGKNFTLAPVHAHILLAGWLTLAMAGVIYRAFPLASRTALAKWHFWLHNVGLPIFVVALGAMLIGPGESAGTVLPAIAVGVFALLAGFTCFALNVWLNANVVGSAQG